MRLKGFGFRVSGMDKQKVNQVNNVCLYIYVYTQVSMMRARGLREEGRLGLGFKCTFRGWVLGLKVCGVGILRGSGYAASGSSWVTEVNNKRDSVGSCWHEGFGIVWP